MMADLANPAPMAGGVAVPFLLISSEDRPTDSDARGPGHGWFISFFFGWAGLFDGVFDPDAMYPPFRCCNADGFAPALLIAVRLCEVLPALLSAGGVVLLNVRIESS